MPRGRRRCTGRSSGSMRGAFVAVAAPSLVTTYSQSPVITHFAVTCDHVAWSRVRGRAAGEGGQCVWAEHQEPRPVGGRGQLNDVGAEAIRATSRFQT